MFLLYIINTLEQFLDNVLKKQTKRRMQTSHPRCIVSVDLEPTISINKTRENE